MRLFLVFLRGGGKRLIFFNIKYFLVGRFLFFFSKVVENG